MKNFGIVLIVIGILGGIFALSMDTTVATERVTIYGQTYGGQRVNNIGLMNDRSNYLIFSSVMLLVGVALLITALKSSGSGSADSTNSSSNTRKCPFCAENVNVDAKICKHCKSPLPELEKVVEEPIAISTNDLSTEDKARINRLKESLSMGFQISSEDVKFLKKMGIHL